jgi:cell division protease FtsH
MIPALIAIIYIFTFVIVAKNKQKIIQMIAMRLFKKKLKNLYTKFTDKHELENGVNLALVNHLTKDFSPAKIDKFVFQAAKIAKSERRQKISMTDINRSWDIVRHGKTVDRKQEEINKRQTALHESAHAVAYLINCPKHCMYQVSISGRNKTLGHCVHLSYKITEKYTKSDYENFIIAYLAGGIGEQYFGEKRQIVENPEAGLNDLKEQSGCHFDFKKAKIIAKNLVVSFKTNSKNSNQILLECYTKAVTLVKTNEDMIMLLAQKLAEKDILYVDEIYSSLNLTRHKFELE